MPDMVTIEAVIEAAGDTDADLARGCGITTANIHQWKIKGGIPPSQAMNVHLLTGIPIESLPVRWATRPDNIPARKGDGSSEE